MLNWLKDKFYYKHKVNTLKNELEVQRRTHAHNTIAWTKQIEDLTASVEYKTAKLKLASKEIKILKEKIKELETPKKRR